MSRKNHLTKPRAKASNSYCLDYIHLPEHPEYGRIIVVPLQTVFVNLNANFDDTVDYIIKDKRDPMLDLVGVEV